MISRKIGEAPSSVGISRRLASTATSTPSSARCFVPPPSLSMPSCSSTRIRSSASTPIAVNSSGTSMPPRAVCTLTPASVGRKKGYRKLAAPTRLASASASVPEIRLGDVLVMRRQSYLRLRSRKVWRVSVPFGLRSPIIAVIMTSAARMSSGVRTMAQQRTDEQIQADIIELLRSAGLPLTASVEDGVLRLQGIVTSEAEREAALDLARLVSGVDEIIDD